MTTIFKYIFCGFCVGEVGGLLGLVFMSVIRSYTEVWHWFSWIIDSSLFQNKHL